MLIETIDDFCENPTREDFIALPRSIQEIFEIVANYALNNGIGNTARARQLHNFYLTRDLNDTALRGFKSLLLAVKSIVSMEEERLDEQYWEQHKKDGKHHLYLNKRTGEYTNTRPSPSVTMTFLNEPGIITIIYGVIPDLPKVFAVDEDMKLFYGKKELLLTYDDLRDYLFSLIGEHKLEIKYLTVFQPTTEKTIPYYSHSLGMLTPEENLDCFRCAADLIDIGVECDWNGCNDDDNIIRKKLSTLHPDKNLGKKDKKKKEEEFKHLRSCKNLVMNSNCLSNIRYHPATFPSTDSLRQT